MLFKDFGSGMNSHKAKRIKTLRKNIEVAESYEEWKNLALKIDEETGVQEWKYNNSSPYFDAAFIAHRLTLLRRYRSQNRIADLMHILREGLTYDIANIAHPMLFTATMVGTKKVIEDYVTEVSNSLAFVASKECQSISMLEKIIFFQACQKAYGQPALMFSGGASLGLFHTGVCKVLLEQDLMPQVMSGSSAEAYEQSGLHINVAVAPYDASQDARIMNAYTAPDLLVWSAVLASCAVPVLFPPVHLTSKRSDGKHTPYMATTTWVDGST